MAMMDKKTLGIAEKPLPSPQLGLLRAIRSRLNRVRRGFFRPAAADRCWIRVRLVWSVLDGGRSRSESERRRSSSKSPDLVRSRRIWRYLPEDFLIRRSTAACGGGGGGGGGCSGSSEMLTVFFSGVARIFLLFAGTW